jgi:hypothetical protein
MLKFHPIQGFSKDVGNLFSRWYIDQVNFPFQDLISDVVMSNIHVLSLMMPYWVLGHFHGALIVTV